MAGAFWFREVPEPIVSSERRLKRPVRSGVLVALILALVVATSPTTLAQMRPEVRDRVIPAAVQIAITGEVTDNGVTGPLALPMGSGTIVSASGQILTAGHVVDMTEHRRMLDSWEAQAAADGQIVSFKLDLESVLIATSDGVSPPQPRYIATIVASDPVLDLAVLQIVGDGSGPIDPASLNLPFVPLGDSDTVALGDAVNIFGYPGIAGGALTYTEGVVSAFNPEGPIGRAWIITDAVASGGSSGGTAVNRQGALIGVLTGGSIECRPGDLNGDGRIDAQDVGCRPVGGSLTALRPSNLTRDLLARAGTTGSSAPGGQDQPPGPAGLPQPPEPEAVSSLPDLLPTSLPLDNAGCFRIDNDRVLTFDELAANLGGTDDARSRLHTWGWQASANRTFACDTPPDGEAGWIDISLHLFGDAAPAQEAVDYFAAVRAEGSTLITAAPPAIGDHAAVLSGPTSNGKEFTLYVSQGPLLVRVTGVSRSGIPFINVLKVTQSILAIPMPQVRPRDQSPSPHDVAAYLPQTLPLDHAACFGMVDEGTLDFPALVDRFPDVPDATSRLQALGWQAGAYRQFGCDGPPAGHAGWIDISLHQFADAASATAAVPFFANSRALGTRLAAATAPGVGDNASALTGPASNGTEYTLYVSHGALLVRITGVAPAGDPGSDVEQVMLGVLAGMGDLPGNPPSAVAPQPPPTPVPSPIILPTATPTPTATAVPTATPTPVPTSTPLPLPTATSTPSPVPSATPRSVVLLPTATTTPTPAMLPTAAPQPTATPPTTTDAKALLDLLLTTQIPEELLIYGRVESAPRLDEESGHVSGLIGAVDFDTGFGGGIHASSISYAVYPGPRDAERALTLWQEGHHDSLETQIDVSGPELGPRAVMLTDADGPYPNAICGAVVGPVVVRASAVGPSETNRDYLNGIVFGNCEGAVAHLRSLIG